MDKYFTHDELVYAIKKAVMDEKRRIVDEMEAIREKFRHDLTGVDKYTLDRIRKLVADYYNAESRLLSFTETCVGKVNEEFTLHKAEIDRYYAGLLPPLVPEDNGKFLRVMDGAWVKYEIVDVSLVGG